MSDYYKSLDGKAKARYKKKLEMAGLTLQNDPYAPVNHEKFKDDMAAWPSVHILPIISGDQKFILKNSFSHGSNLMPTSISRADMSEQCS